MLAAMVSCYGLFRPNQLGEERKVCNDLLLPFANRISMKTRILLCDSLKAMMVKICNTTDNRLCKRQQCNERKISLKSKNRALQLCSICVRGSGVRHPRHAMQVRTR